MKNLRYIKIMALLIATFAPVAHLVAQESSDEVVIRAMKDELNRSKNELKLGNYPTPFYLSYTVYKSHSFDISGTLGAITRSVDTPNNSLASVRLMLGNYTRSSEVRYGGQYPSIQVTGEENYDNIRRSLWLATDNAYKAALQTYSSKAAYLKNNPRSEEYTSLADFTKGEATQMTIKRNAEFNFDRAQWEKNISELSAIFKNYKELFNSSVGISGMSKDIYKTNSEGAVINQPNDYVLLYAKASIITEDNVSIEDTYTSLALTPGELPSLEELKKQVTKFADNLRTLAAAEPINEYYSGPVLFEEGAASKLFVDNLLIPGGLMAYRASEGEPIKPTLDRRIGKKVIDSRLSVRNLSSQKKQNGTTLCGAYDVDAEGVVPPKEITLIENGILKSQLSSRVPTPKVAQSTGSSRYTNNQQIGFETAPGTIAISVKGGEKPENMKKALIKAAKEEGLEYAYIVRKVSGLSSLIYKVDVKSGQEKQVRSGSFTPINLAKLKHIREISNKEKVSNYMLNKQVISSLIYPSGVLIEDVEINKAEVKKEPKAKLTFPLQRTSLNRE